MATPEWFEEQVLKGLARVEDNKGLTCGQLNSDHVDFWPLYPLQRLHRMEQVRAIRGRRTLTAAIVAALGVTESADTVVWRLTQTGKTRAAQLK